MIAEELLYSGLLGLGIILGYFLFHLIQKKKTEKDRLLIDNLHREKKQLNADYQILLQAMEGSKAQAEDMQRKLYGTNVLEISEPEDPEAFIKRQRLVRFVQQRLSSSDRNDSKEKTNVQQLEIIQSLNKLDDQVINILSETIPN